MVLCVIRFIVFPLVSHCFSCPPSHRLDCCFNVWSRQFLFWPSRRKLLHLMFLYLFYSCSCVTSMTTRKCRKATMAFNTSHKLRASRTHYVKLWCPQIICQCVEMLMFSARRSWDRKTISTPRCCSLILRLSARLSLHIPVRKQNASPYNNGTRTEASLAIYIE